MTFTADSIVNPIKPKNISDLGRVAVMVSTQADLVYLCHLMNMDESRFRGLFMSRLYIGDDDNRAISLAGPMIGAPYSTMILEALIAWGANIFLFFGWCGSISPNVRVGDIIVPESSIIDEGTSRHYENHGLTGSKETDALSYSSERIIRQLKIALNQCGHQYHAGTIWSTDAIFRETREKVEYYQKKNILAVEMEVSALYNVGRFRNVEVGGVLVVSDELSTFQWRPGFNDNRFKSRRKAVCEVIYSLCQTL
ncbi:MAG: nucleoside phosphorylase [Desulfobacterales bacterium]|jgi:uridine phosphorylase|nr:nucleoside phosphorylase [Desulfobacterales bacterium]MDP7417433.1 nucleoside phosphorylase [Desulfobacterales bacterium]|tara:strand:- start:125 stop:883 length:759 start_codon:yes stop_codon:yes gene_type:complete